MSMRCTLVAMVSALASSANLDNRLNTLSDTLTAALEAHNVGNRTVQSNKVSAKTTGYSPAPASADAAGMGGWVASAIGGNCADACASTGNGPCDPAVILHNNPSVTTTAGFNAILAALHMTHADYPSSCTFAEDKFGVHMKVPNFARTPAGNAWCAIAQSSRTTASISCDVNAMPDAQRLCFCTPAASPPPPTPPPPTPPPTLARDSRTTYGGNPTIDQRGLVLDGMTNWITTGLTASDFTSGGSQGFTFSIRVRITREFSPMTTVFHFGHCGQPYAPGYPPARDPAYNAAQRICGDGMIGQEAQWVTMGYGTKYIPHDTTVTPLEYYYGDTQVNGGNPAPYHEHLFTFVVTAGTTSNPTGGMRTYKDARNWMPCQNVNSCNDFHPRQGVTTPFSISAESGVSPTHAPLNYFIIGSKLDMLPWSRDDGEVGMSPTDLNVNSRLAGEVKWAGVWDQALTEAEVSALSAASDSSSLASAKLNPVWFEEYA
jgi:hypothetical protein